MARLEALRRQYTEKRSGIKRASAAAIAAVLFSDVAVAANRLSHSSSPFSAVVAEDTILPGIRRAILPRETTTTTTDFQAPTTTTIIPETTTTTEPPQEEPAVDLRPQVVVNGKIAHVTETPIDEETQAHLDAMNMTLEGYINFWNSIDMSHYDYAQQFIEFNPEYVPIEQGGETLQIFQHYSVSKPYGDGVTVSVDQVDVDAFIHGTATQFDDSPNNTHLCCGFGWAINPEGIASQTAPVDARLRHAYGFDANTIGIETIAMNQPDITTAQLEARGYLTIGISLAKGLLKKYSLTQISRGHGEDTDREMIADPSNPRNFDIRNDEDAPISEAQRVKWQEFLDGHPELHSLEPTFDESGRYVGLADANAG